MNGWFKPLRGRARTQSILAFDIEGTGGPDGFVCGAICGLTVSGFYTSRQAMLADLVGYGRDGYWIFSHNLQYDLPILEGDAFPIGEVVFTRYNILSSKYDMGERTVRFLDSANLFPRHSVEMIGEMVGYPKDKLPEDVFAKLCQGRKWDDFSLLDQEAIRRYCRRDAEIVYMGVSMLQELVLALGGQLHPTISGTALDIYRRKFHRWPWPVVGEKTNELARPAYYGGRVENFAMGKVENVSVYDVTSLYPYVQAQTRYPHPNHLRLDVSPSSSGEFWRGEGIVQADVDVPDTFAPPLPLRYQARLFFPVGRLRGTWTILELRRALGYGAALRSVEWALWSPVTFNPFEEYVYSLFDLRSYYLSAGKGQANLVKLLLNSLIGRFGLDPEQGLFRLVSIDHAGDLGKYEGYSTYDVNGRLLAFGGIEKTRYPDYVNVPFAAQVTAAGRAHLHDGIARQGDGMIYCDTDSIMTTGKIETSDDLGGWREIMTGASVDLIGLKEYALHNAVVGTKYVAKGVPEDVAKAYLETGVARFYRALGVREALRDKRRPSTWVETFKSRNETFPKRYPVPPWVSSALPYLQTRAYRADELPLVVQGLFLPPEVDPDFRGLVHPREPQRTQKRLDL